MTRSNLAIRIMPVLWLMTFSCCCQAGQQLNNRSPIRISMQELLNNTEQYIDDKLQVFGYLSENCLGLCLFSYEDDSEHFNTPNAVQFILNADVAASIKKGCGDGYVVVVGRLQTVGGFARPGFTQVDQVRTKNPETGESNICWDRAGSN